MKAVETGDIPLCIKPETDDPDSIQIFVNGRVGQKAYAFLLDTGAARSAVIADAALMALTPQGIEETTGGFGAARQEDVITIPEIVIGPIRKTKVPLVRLPPQDRMPNILGMDFLRHYTCHFCFSAAKLRLNPPAKARPVQPLLALHLDDRGHPYVDVETGSGSLSAVWDSGAGMTVMDLAVIARHPELFEPAGESMGIDATGVGRATPVFRMGDLRIGRWTFQPHKVVGVDLSGVNAGLERPMDLILGANLILREDWWFDFPGRRWAVTSRDTEPTP